MANGQQPERRLTAAMQARFLWEIVLHWLFGDVLYTVLPLAVTTMLLWLLRRPWDELIVSPEWSFASIICFGLSIRSLIDIKVRHQHDFSFKLDTGSQAFVLLLIASVLTLAAAQLRLWGLYATDAARNALAAAQFGLLGIGLFSLFVVTYYRQAVIRARETFPPNLTKRRFTFCLDQNLGSATQSLGAALAGARQIEFFLNNPDDHSLHPVTAERLHGRLAMLLDEIDAASAEIRDILATHLETQSTKDARARYVRLRVAPGAPEAVEEHSPDPIQPV